MTIAPPEMLAVTYTQETNPAVGDDARWQELQQVLERALSRLARTASASKRDDLVQEGMLRLVRQQEPVNNSYVWKVAHSVVRDRQRRARRKPEHGEDGLRTATDGQPGPDRLAQSTEIRDKVRACLEAAPESRRDLLTLYLLGHPPKECSQLLGVTRKRAENAIYRGMSALRECLRSKGLG